MSNELNVKIRESLDSLSEVNFDDLLEDYTVQISEVPTLNEVRNWSMLRYEVMINFIDGTFLLTKGHENGVSNIFPFSNKVKSSGHNHPRVGQGNSLEYFYALPSLQDIILRNTSSQVNYIISTAGICIFRGKFFEEFQNAQTAFIKSLHPDYFVSLLTDQDVPEQVFSEYLTILSSFLTRIYSKYPDILIYFQKLQKHKTIVDAQSEINELIEYCKTIEISNLFASDQLKNFLEILESPEESIGYPFLALPQEKQFSIMVNFLNANGINIELLHWSELNDSIVESILKGEYKSKAKEA